MPAVFQNSFTGGEWAPSLYGRADLQKYFTAVKTMRNAFPHPHGGASNRPGFEFINEVKDSSKFTRLVPFQFSVVQSYILEFGDEYFRVYKDGGIVLAPAPHETDPYEVETPFAEADLPLLKFTQSADVLFVTHPKYAPVKITRTAHNAWSLATMEFGSSVTTPTSVSCSGGSGDAKDWKVTAVDVDGEESEPSTAANGNKGCTITWTAVSGAVYYNLYKDQYASGVYGWAGQANTNSFSEPSTGILPSFEITPPVNREPFNTGSNYPGCSAFFEQRLVFARTDSEPQTIWGSVIGSFGNLNISYPIKDDDSYKFTLNAQQVNEIRWMVPMLDMIIGTSGGEWRMSAGGQSDAVTPTSVDMKTQSVWGVADLSPNVIGNSVLFLDISERKVRNLSYSQEGGGYKSSDLSLLANHLFDTYKIVDWAYQQSPDSIVWCVRDDGALIGLTYYEEHDVIGWHRHDTDGWFESVASIKVAGGATELWAVITREVDGNEVRYIERLFDRITTEDTFDLLVENSKFLDSSLLYNGWNDTEAHVVTLTGGTTWVIGQALTLTASGGHTPFLNSMVGRYITLRSGEDKVIVKVTGYTSSTVLTVAAWSKTVPTALRSVATYDWSFMATVLSGIDHLEGKEVYVLSDGNVIKNLTVASGSVTIPYPGSKILLGLPFVSDIETLSLEYPTKDGSVQDKQRTISSVLLRLQNTRALWVGPDADRLNELKMRSDEDYGDPINLYSGDKEIAVETGDSRSGSLFIRNEDPVPFTILALVARADYGED